MCFLLLLVYEQIAFCFAVVYFPASGLHHRVTGEFINLGSESDSWSSSPYGVSNVNGSYLFLNTVCVFPLACTGRGYCFPVRCVQELAVVFYIVVVKYHFNSGVSVSSEVAGSVV